MHCARVRRTVFHGPRRRAGRHRKGLAAGADRGPIQCPSGPRPKGPGASLRDDRGGGVSLSPEREAGLVGIAETLAAGAAVHGGKPAV